MTATARGLAICPICTNSPPGRARCWFCRGLGFVPREARNRYKRDYKRDYLDDRRHERRPA